MRWSIVPIHQIVKIVGVRNPKLKSRRWLRKRLAMGFELSRGGPAKEIEPSAPAKRSSSGVQSPRTISLRSDDTEVDCSDIASVDPTDARLRNARLSCRGRLQER